MIAVLPIVEKYIKNSQESFSREMAMEYHLVIKKSEVIQHMQMKRAPRNTATSENQVAEQNGLCNIFVQWNKTYAYKYVEGSIAKC